MRRFALLTVLLVVLACSSDPTNPPADPADVRVYPSHVFAGGEVFLSGDWYRSTDSLPQITAGASLLSVRRVNDTTVAATLPSTANGIVKLGELSPRALYDRGSVIVYGFHRHASVPVPNHFELTASWEPSSPYIAIDTDSGLSVLDPRVDTAARYLGIGSLGSSGRASCPRAAGPTYRPNAFVLSDTALFAGYDVWSVLPDTAKLDHLLVSGCMVAEIAPLLYAIDRQTSVNVYQLDSAGQVVAGFQQGMATHHRFTKSPAGDRLAIAAFHIDGAVIVNLQTLTTAYTAPAMELVSDAAFNTDGSRLYLSGGAASGAQSGEVLALNAATGDSLAAALFPSAGAFPIAVTHDPLRGVIYVALPERDTVVGARMSIHVLDEETLVPWGKLQVPDAAGCGFCFLGSKGVVRIDQAGSELMLVVSLGVGVEIYHFRLPPAP